jgi:hypothetical protein
MMGGERPGMVRCPSCGRLNRATREICAACGAALDRPLGAPSPPPTPARGSTPQPPRPSYADLGDLPGVSASSSRSPRRSSDRRGAPTYRERRWGLIVVGAVFLLIAAILLADGAATYTTTKSEQIPVGDAWVLSQTALTAESATFSWHGTPSTMHVYLTTSSAKCPPSGGILVNRTGARGGFAFTLQPGDTYQLFACSNGELIQINATVTETGGVSLGVVIGIVLLILGLPLLLIGLRGRLASAYGD